MVGILKIAGVTAMGLQKGSISLSPTHDIPLLLQVLHAQFITHGQLFEFSRLGCYEFNRSTFNWRASRLVQAAFCCGTARNPVRQAPYTPFQTPAH